MSIKCTAYSNSSYLSSTIVITVSQVCQLLFKALQCGNETTE